MMLGQCSPFLTSTGDHVILKGVWSDQLSLATIGNEVIFIVSCTGTLSLLLGMCGWAFLRKKSINN